VSPRVLPATLWPPYPSLEPRRVGGAVTATGVAGHKGARPSRGGLTGEPLGVSRRTRWETRAMAEGVGRRNLSCTGKPRGLREISGRTRGGDQANRLNRSGSQFPGYLMPGGVAEGRHPSNEGRKPGPVPWGLPPSGPASAPTGGRAWPQALPRQREGGLPGRGVSESAGREAPKEGRGPKGSTGEGTPRRDPGGPAGRSRPQGRARSGLLDQPRWPRPIRGGAARPHRVSHSRPQARKWGAVPGGTPGATPAKQGRSPTASCERSRGRRPKGPAGPQAVKSPGLRDALIPKGPPLLPPAHRRGVSALCWEAMGAIARR
jgi:hypothetical protein